MNIIFQYFNTSIGELKIGSFGDEIVIVDWRYRKMRKSVDQRLCKLLNTEFEEGESPAIAEATAQLIAYFQGQRKTFDLPIRLVGTDFQKTVWKQLQRIPFGKTNSYLALSKDLGNEKAVRAVASANGANAIAIIVPCHRIIGSNNDLVGYAGGLVAKKKLLQLENNEFDRQLTLF